MSRGISRFFFFLHESTTRPRRGNARLRKESCASGKQCSFLFDFFLNLFHFSLFVCLLLCFTCFIVLKTRPIVLQHLFFCEGGSNLEGERGGAKDIINVIDGNPLGF